MVAVCCEIPLRRLADRDQGFVTPLSGDKALELSTALPKKTFQGGVMVVLLKIKPKGDKKSKNKNKV